ncbi:MAG TPA: arginine--tRNA ligase [Cytophagaceae bacterium]
MRLEDVIKSGIQLALKELFSYELGIDQIFLQPTKKEFEGTYTFVTFTLTRELKKSPEEIANQIGTFLKENVKVVSGYNVIKGFLNLEIADEAWGEVLNSVLHESFAAIPQKNEKVIVEYSSPNTNKPLHLGHLRNNFLGYSVAEILKANGYQVTKVNLINDRGIHICKSMLAYLKFGNFETPDSSGIKGDHLIGKYYVRFNQELEAQVDAMIRRWSNGIYEELPEDKIGEVQNLIHALNNTNPEIEAEKYKGIRSKLKDIAEDYAQILKEAQQMLVKWEQGDHEIRQLWERMNAWVYDGFNATYEDIGVDFDRFYYESETYLLGKQVVQEGLDKGIFFRKEDNSVWVNLTDVGLDEKLLLRGDGTSVYITQDLGTADLKYRDYHANKSIYVVGNEQDYHFNVLKEIVKKLERPYADGIYHLSYGMVDLPSGKMKSREGTVVDADELLMEMIETAEKQTQELGKIEGFSDEEARNLYKVLGLGALKYFLLKVDPKKRMLFNPQESIEFQGNTGPFIQYTHARISAILRKAKQLEVDYLNVNFAHINSLHPSEREVIVLLNEFPAKLAEAARDYAPSVIAQYAYDLAKEYNRFYAEVSIFNEDDKLKLAFRIALSYAVAKVIRKAMALLGIQVPERM